MSNDKKSYKQAPLDEARFSKALRTSLDQLEKISMDIIAAMIQVQNMESDLVVRDMERRGLSLRPDDFGQKKND